MRSLIILLVAIAAMTAMAADAPPIEFTPLFDGQSLKGWVQRGGKAEYRVEDSAIVGCTVPDTPNSFLCTEKEYADFILEFEVKIDPALNSGVQFRSKSIPEYKDGRVHGYQVEIDPSDRAFSGGIYDEGRRGWLQDLKNNEEGRKAFKKNDWNRYRVEAVGDYIKTFVNGIKTADMQDTMTLEGFIALQVHATKSTAPLEVRWRDIKIHEVVARNTMFEDAPHIGDYEGKFPDERPVAAQIIAQGSNQYKARILNSLDKPQHPIVELEATLKNGSLVFTSGTIEATVRDDFRAKDPATDEEIFAMTKSTRNSRTLNEAPPKGAIVLFDGNNLDEWQKADGSPARWEIVGDNAMEIARKAGNIETKKLFKDCKIHLEFRTPNMPNERGQKRGNSGVYVQGCYEIQILDSYGLEGLDNECGGIYKVGRPLVNMCAPPLQWQTYDIDFTAAKFDDGGGKTANARITVEHNGVVIHKDLELPGPTGGAKWKSEPKDGGPILLQDHGNPVQFRNIWVVEKTKDTEKK